MEVARLDVSPMSWTVYPWALLRSAGFPAATVLELAVPDPAEAVRRLCRLPAFQEAILWQNPPAFRTAIRPLAERQGAPTARDRQMRHRLVASYLQRYCVKNETIGFFGASRWGRIAESGPALSSPHAAHGLTERTVYIEPWAIDALADVLSNDSSLKPWMAPRRLPRVGLDGAADLPARRARLLARCTGRLTAAVIASDLAADPTSGFATTDAVLAELATLEKEGLIAWRFEVPLDLDPSGRLRDVLARIAPPALRRRALVPLVEMEEAREAVARAAGDVTQLDQALGGLEATFHRLTGRVPHRLPGATYAGRTVVYEDCTRAIDVSVGPGLLARIGPAVGLLGTAARWLTHDVAARYRTAFERLYRDTCGDGPSRVPLLRLLQAEPSLFRDVGEGRSSLVERARETLLARWQDVLGAPGHQELRIDSAALAPRLHERFACPGPGWGLGGRHTIDVLLGADGVDAVAAGRYQAVIGQIHVASANSLIGCYFRTHPDPDAQRALEARNLPDPLVYLQASGRSARNRAAALPAGTWFVDIRDELAADPSRTLHVADLVVEPGPRGLDVCHAGQGVRLPLLDFLASSLGAQTRRAFGILAPAGHTPRVLIDDVVVAREQWVFEPAEMPFAALGHAAERLVLFRRWAARHALPRFFFVRPPRRVEVKPLFCDLESPLYVELFCKTVRRTRDAGGSVAITEMLPGIADCWLADLEGRRYTSEFRLVIRDPLAPMYGRS